MSNLLAVTLILIAGIGPVIEPEYVPKGDVAYTIDLEREGYVNGHMDPDRLMRHRGCTLERDAAYLFSLMMDAAEEDGMTLKGRECYRTYNEQSRAYDKRCPVTAIPVIGVDEVTGEKIQLGTRDKRVCSGPPVAPPGKSNHGWGRAVDFADRYNILTCYDDEYLWLVNNAHRFGWVHPAWAKCGLETQEPWHWEFAGVTDPTLVEYVVIDQDLLPPLE